MLEGVVPFPPEFARRYRERGYWAGRSLAQEFAVALGRFADRVALIDRDREYTYRDVDRMSDRLALNLLELGLRPLDRVVVQLPNVAEFVTLYVALQKAGAIPVAALATHRYNEVSQFVRIASAVACAYPEAQGDFRFGSMIQRIQAESASLRWRFVLGNAGAGERSLAELIEREPALPRSMLEKIVIDPSDPAVFQLSGGTTGIPKLIPRTHNDYAYNSRTAAPVCGVTGDSILLLVLPIAHNLPLACPGIQGYFFSGGKIVLSTHARPEEMLGLIEKHRVTHIKLVPALLIRLIDSPGIRKFDLSSLKVIQCGGQRLQPEVRMRAKQLIPGATVQENFGMAEGMLFFVRLDDPEDVRLETCGRPISPDDEARLVDEEGRDVAEGDVGELACRGPYTLRGYFNAPEHNARGFTPDGYYLTGDLMRRHPSGNYVVEGRKKDLINRGGEKISAEEIENLILSHPGVQNVACVALPDAVLGERMCACVIPRMGHALEMKELTEFLMTKEIAKFKLPERLEIMDDFPLSTFGKVSKKALVAMVSERSTVNSKQ
ncbi:MAG TPA: AMP-binding protein [Burkholderiales bacterium]|nr:AMP-binding protein [Burkholderiales bacterium]